jgi:FMN reductase (NADPH)
MTDLLLNRRTIRKYTEKDIDDTLLHEILNAGCRSSTTGNMQLYSIIITRDEKMKKELAPLHLNQKMVTEAPVLLTFCADFNRFKKWCGIRNAVPGYDNFLSFMTAAIDTIILTQTICIAAESMGLGICYLGTTTYTANKIIEVLELPAGVVPVTTISMGWPAEFPSQVDRLPLEAIVHNEKYVDYDSGNLEYFYSSKESLPDSLQFVKENNKETLAQVFTDIRYKKTDNEYFSGVLLKVLRDQGFLE